MNRNSMGREPAHPTFFLGAQRVTLNRKGRFMIEDALTFPFRGVGRYMLIIGGVLLLILWFMAAFSIIRMIRILIPIVASGFFGAYYFNIVNTTACGKDETCDWPDIQYFWSDIFATWLCVLSAFLCSFAPLLVIVFLIEPPVIIRIVLLVIGIAHLPMALLSVAIFRNPRAAFWSNTIPAIMRCLPQYAVLFLIFGLLTIANIGVNKVLSSVPVAGRLISSFLGMYALMMSARLIGLFYRNNGGIFDR